MSRRIVVTASIVVAGLVAAGIFGVVARGGGQKLSQASAPRPIAEVDCVQFDLGIVESSDTYRHTFTIRNAGNAPLTVARGPATCNCTTTELPQEPIPPGRQSEIGVSYTNDGHMGPFTIHPTILTNDPDRPSIELKMVGNARSRLTAEPRKLTMMIRPPKHERSASTLVYSQYWDRFELSVMKASLKSIEWKIEPASEEQLRPLDARSGYNVRVTMPPDMIDGHFSEWIRLSAKPNGPAEPPRELQLDITGNVYGHVTLHGPKIDAARILRLGAVAAATGARDNLVLHVHQEPRELNVRGVETSPPFVQVHILPCNGKLHELGLYRIEVEIPAGSPSINCVGDQAGTIRLKTDHPLAPVIEWKVEFAVVDGVNVAGQ